MTTITITVSSDEVKSILDWMKVDYTDSLAEKILVALPDGFLANLEYSVRDLYEYFTYNPED